MRVWWYGGRVILVWPAEHNFEHNTLVSRVTPESITLYFSSIIRETLLVSRQVVTNQCWVWRLSFAVSSGI